jgi:nucleotide-binding universal stress UspA family protein
LFKSIIWATDGSEHATRALTHTVGLSRAESAAFHAVHVVEFLPAGRSAGGTVKCDEDAVSDRIQEQAESLSTQGIRPIVHLPHAPSGHAADRIADLAQELWADLIVVGTRGHSAMAGVVLGSVTQRLLHLSPCPILAVPPVRDDDADQPRSAEPVAVID